MRDMNDVRRFIARESARLDPSSRYIAELLAIVSASSGPGDLERLLDAGCRGKHWAGEQTFSAMTFEEKLRCNLVTNETSLMRFDDAELAYLRGTALPDLAKRDGAHILSLPCSHGEEAAAWPSNAWRPASASSWCMARTCSLPASRPPAPAGSPSRACPST